MSSFACQTSWLPAKMKFFLPLIPKTAEEKANYRTLFVTWSENNKFEYAKIRNRKVFQQILKLYINFYVFINIFNSHAIKNLN